MAVSNNSDILSYVYLVTVYVCMILSQNTWCLYILYKFDTCHCISVNVTELNCLCSHAAIYCNWLVVIIQNNGKNL